MALLQETVIENPYIQIQPTPTQAVFLTQPHLEIMYGGAGGGGKTAGLLAASLQYVTEPEYSAILFRRTFTDLWLEGSLIPLSLDWLSGTDATWDGQHHAWHFPSGAVLQFGYMQSEQDRFRYKSAEFQFCGFDELTGFAEVQYRYLFSRLRRREGMTVPLRVRSCTNPGDVGHEWVKQRFLVERVPDRLFVPAKLEDNPHLDQEEYDNALSHLDPVTRAQMRHGDWDTRVEGNLFKREWFDVVDDAPPLRRVVRYWDLAATEESAGEDPDFTAGLKMGVSEHGIYYIFDVEHFRESPLGNRQRIATRTAKDGHGVGVRFEQEGGSSGKSLIDVYRRDVLRGYDVRGIRSTGDKVTRARPFSAACEAGDVKLIRGTWIGRWLDELCAFPQKGVHDDQVDASSGAFNAIAQEGGVEHWNESDIRDLVSDPDGGSQPQYHDLLRGRLAAGRNQR